MKKVITMIALLAVAGAASADLSYFKIQGGNLYDNTSTAYPFGTMTEGAVIQLVDLSAFVVGGQINIADIPSAYTTVDIAVAPPLLGGAYSTGTISERPSTVIGETAYLVFDPNGGGIQVGDLIGLGTGAEILDMAAAGSPAPADPQIINPGDITANIEVIPEPATIGLMGVAGLGMFLARRKARR